MTRAAYLCVAFTIVACGGSAAFAEPDHTAPAPDVQAAGELPPEFWQELEFHASSLTATPKNNFSRPGDNTGLNWSRSEKPDGSTAVTAKQAVPVSWDTKFGVDLGLAPSPGRIPLEPMPQPGATTGAAWASTKVPALALPMGWDKASIDARVDPAQETGKFGTTFDKSVPLGERFSVTLQNGYAATGTLANPNNNTVGATALPPTGPSHVYSTEGLAKLNILPSGTSFSTGGTITSTDEKWLRSIGVEQKLFGGVSVKGAVSETATGAPNRSFSAGFKRTW